MDALVRDKAITLMFIGIYRSNEVDETHCLSKVVRHIRESQESGAFAITELSTGNLDVATCEEVLVALLSVDADDRTRGLAEICHKRTHGNPFHLLAYLEMLQGKELLQFQLGRLQWTWDTAQIEAGTTLTSNVSELIGAKIEKQTRAVRDLLRLTACLGSSFDEALVICSFPIMYDDAADEPPATEKVRSLLSLAVGEAFLESEGPTRYRWVHDSVQAAAMQFGGEDETAAFRFELGKLLLLSLAEEDLEENVFVIANMLNAVECSETDRVTIAELNLRASKVGFALDCVFSIFMTELTCSCSI